MTAAQERNLTEITRRTEQVVLNTIADAQATINRLEGPVTEPDAERARAQGLIGDAEALAAYANDLSNIVIQIRQRIGESVPPPTAPAGR